VSHGLKAMHKTRWYYIAECCCGWTSALHSSDWEAETALKTHTEQQDAVDRVREEAIERSDRPPSEIWKRHAAEVIRATALALPLLTSEDVWEHGLRSPDNGSPDGDALGPAMLRAKDAGIIEFTGRTVTKTDRPQRHNNPKRLWRSLIYKEQSQ